MRAIEFQVDFQECFADSRRAVLCIALAQAEVFATGGAGITTMPLKDHGALKDHEAGWS